MSEKTSIAEPEAEPEAELKIDTSQMSEGKRQALEVAEAAREAKWEHPSFVGELFMGRFHDNLTARATQLSTPELQNIHPRRIARMEASLQSLGYTGRDEQPAEEEDE